ncbi:MAG: DUF1553 domain-containing protein [Acidobacteria bacterium]|nr:DUF1553 domain-containing protein [Acidobacteriota bacterium]
MRFERYFLLLAALPLAAQSPEQIDFFEAKIRPVLVERCEVCHGAGTPVPQGGLRVDSRQGLLEGGASGPALVPGKPERSRLIQALSYEDESLQMPPGGKLADEQVEAFRAWVAMGAPDPRTGTATAPPAPASEPLWSLVAPKSVEPPANAGRTRIDRFVLARLTEAGLEPSPAADPRTLLRRLSYDLIGLPPSAAELDAFAQDASPDAYARALDRLLDSPGFGERWARHWLDVVRYSDDGAQAKPFPTSWVYRDWVIRALNQDMPYDRFVVEQLAADQLEDGDARRLAALGLLTLGINLPRATDVPENLDDRIDVVTRGLLGLSVACARCHDHKFDPIPQKDYYALYGVFLNSPDAIEPTPIEPIGDSPLDRFYQKRLEVRRRQIDEFRQERLEDHKAELRERKALERYLQAAWDGRELSNTQLEKMARERDLNLYVLRRWRETLRAALERNDPRFRDFAASQLAARLAEASRPEPWPGPEKESLRQLLWGDDAPTNVPFEDFWWIQTEGDSNTVKQLTWQYEGVLADWLWRGGPQHAMTVYDAPQPEPAYVFVRGNQNDKGAAVPRRFLTALGGRRFEHGSGRLELARAIVDPKNPLTARVWVNRVWSHLFGEGLVRTPSDFGVRGAEPTHPELLDDLAVRFVRQGWSTKRLIREIALSDAYRQSSADRPAARAQDPENLLLWRQNRRRLGFEPLRDTLLAVSGRLEGSVGGPPFQLQAEPSVPRRSLYAYISREQISGLLRTFDFSNPEQHTPQRQTTTSPQQALFLLNSPFILEQARALLARVEQQGPGDDAERVGLLYRDALGRSATPAELKLAADFLAARASAHGLEPAADDPAASAWSYGWGRLDPEAGRVEDFRAFAEFVDGSWRQSSQLPDPEAGMAELTATGGRPGDGLGNAVVRRWTAPFAGKVDLEGELRHTVGPYAERFDTTNGVRGWLLSSRRGALGSWTLRGLSASTAFSGLEVEQGERLDFVVDARGDYEDDAFSWAPVLRRSLSAEEKKAGMAAGAWNARDDFRGPRPAALSPWEEYAQTLLLTNELIFLD